MIIILQGVEYTVHGFRITEGHFTYVYATDINNNLYKLTWITSEEQNNSNTTLVVVYRND